AVPCLDELVDAIRRQRRDQPGQVTRVLCDRVLLVQLPDLLVELGRELAAVDLEHSRVGHAPSLSRGRTQAGPSASASGSVPTSPGSRSTGVTNASTTAGANCVPRFRMISSVASSSVRAQL